jgi:hypothetical protein
MIALGQGQLREFSSTSLKLRRVFEIRNNMD